MNECLQEDPVALCDTCGYRRSGASNLSNYLVSIVCVAYVAHVDATAITLEVSKPVFLERVRLVVFTFVSSCLLDVRTKNKKPSCR